MTYGKNEADIKRGRTQGRINVGTAIISAKTEMFRIDIDDEECIHHLKVILSILNVLIIRHFSKWTFILNRTFDNLGTLANIFNLV